MNYVESHDAVMLGVAAARQVASVSGRATARVHLILDPGEVVRVLVEGYAPTFYWRDRPICGTVSTRGWIDITADDPREVCQLCRRRWVQLAGRYWVFAEREMRGTDDANQTGAR